MAENKLGFSEFKFNFPNPHHVLENPIKETPKVDKLVFDWCSAVSEITPSVEEQFLKDCQSLCSTLSLGTFCIKYLTSSALLKVINLNGRCCKLLETETSVSDLEPGIYEGGFKIWECTLDLVSYLENTKSFELKPKVLELGCGSGLPALLAYLNGCDVTFQDFNREVLEMLTVSNVLLNTPDSEVPSIAHRCSFVAGHWQGVKEKYYTNNAPHERYDVILTSETIYNKENQQHLLELMKAALKSDGVIYLAAKTHYFGVGGTLEDFVALIKIDGTFACEEVYGTNEGVQRKIIAIRFSK